MSENPYSKVTPAHITALLEPIEDPEVGVGIVDLGLIYDVRVDGGKVEVDMTLTSLGCPAGEFLYQMVSDTVRNAPGVESSTVNLVWDPPWGPDRINPEVRFALDLM